MKRKLTFLLIPVLLITLVVAYRLSAARASIKSAPEQCMQEAAQIFAQCMQDNHDCPDNREGCREIFECMRDNCQAEKKGATIKKCPALKACGKGKEEGAEPAK